MRRFLLRTFLLLLVAGCGAAAALLWEYHQTLDRPIAIDGTGASLMVQRGDSINRLARDLDAAGLTGPSIYLRIHARLDNGGGAIKAGEYRIHAGDTVRDLYRRLRAGEVARHSVTLVEGWTVREMLTVLHRHPALENKADPENWEDLMAKLGHEDVHPEGRFYPDTYVFTRGASDLDILKRARERMEAVVEVEWAERADGLPYDTPYEALVMASIVEAEARLAEEQRRIAGVFVRRLEKGMRLQADPTVVYALGSELEGPLLRVHWQHESPYNTYRNHGLPPTPIGAPGRGAIRAALDPQPGDALYFVARGDGSHHFSTTLEEHNRAVQRYRRNGEDSSD